MSEDASDDEDWFEDAVSDASDREDESDSDERADDATQTESTGGPSDGDDAAVDADREPTGATEAESPGSGRRRDEDARPGTDAGVDEAGGIGGAGGFDDAGGLGGASEFADAGGSGAEGGLFEEDFESAFESAGGPGTDFDEESFDSDIPRVDLGITGLDAMIQGGVPERHLMVTIGSAGTGKTTFGLQFLHHGLERGENAVFITLEQSREAVVATAEERGWEFERHEDEGSLAVVDLDPVEMANSLDNIRGELPDLVAEFGADRLVLDSVSLLEMMYDRQARRRTEVFDFTRSLKEAGVTTMLTSEASESNPYASRHGIIEYLTDAVFVLQYVRSETQETRLAVEIQKIRDANHSRATKPYEITMDGISVYQQANIF